MYALQTRSIPAGRARIALLFAATILSAQIRYTGTIDRDLKVVDGSWATFIFQSATESDFESLPSSADRKHLAHAGRLPETKTRFVITDSPVNGAIVYVDLNADGKYSTNEQFRFHRQSENATGEFDPRCRPTQKACFDIPITGKSIDQFPVCIQLYDPANSIGQDGSRSLNLAIAPWVTGSVTVGSRKVIVGYEYDLKHDAVDPTNGWLGLRESGNGSIDFLSDSPETAFAEKEQIVFRVADLYLSTESVDLKQNRVVLLSHPAADYLRIELQRGAVLPDWNFVDLAGRPGSLKSYAGKYVMLDVWTASCGWCLEEFATLKSAVQRFGSRNFEILGVLGDQDEVEARKAEEQHGLPWCTAASGSTFEYAQRRLRIASWPTHILLDPDGLIISASSSELRDEALLKTLQALLSH